MGKRGCFLLCQAQFIIYIHRCDLKYNLNKTKFSLDTEHLTLAYTGIKEVKSHAYLIKLCVFHVRAD